MEYDMTSRPQNNGSAHVVGGRLETTNLRSSSDDATRICVWESGAVWLSKDVYGKSHCTLILSLDCLRAALEFAEAKAKEWAQTPTVAPEPAK